MVSTRCAVLMVFVAVACCKVSISNLNHDFEPKDEMDYVNYLKLILGRNDESTTISAGLSELAARERPSLTNAVSRIVLAFIPHASKEDSEHFNEVTTEIEMKGKLLQQLVFETPQLFIVTHLPASEENTLHRLMDAYSAENKVVHVIRGDSKEVSRLAEMLNMESPEYEGKINHPTRLLTQKQVIQTSQTDSTYLIKFFFALLFIIVIVAVIGFIAQNDGKRDTLLYARFLTEVNSR